MSDTSVPNVAQSDSPLISATVPWGYQECRQTTALPPAAENSWGGGASTSSEVPEAAERQYCTQRNLSRSVLIVDSSEMTSDRYLPHPQPQRGAAPDASRCCRGHKGPTAKCNWEKLYLASSLAGHFLGDFNLLKSLWIPRIWEFHGECNTLQCCFPLEPSLMKNLQG